MAKKQIKQIRVDVSTRGAKDVGKELQGINNEIDNINANARQMGGMLKGPTKAIETLYTRSKHLSKSFDSIAKSSQAMNRAMSGSDAATKKMDSYITNLEVVESVLKDVANTAERASSAMKEVGNSGTISDLSVLEDQLDAILQTMVEMAQDTKEVVRGFDRLEDSVEANVTQTKKGRKAMDGYRGSMESTTAATNRANKATERMVKNGRNSRNTLSELARIGGPMTTMYATVAANIFALSEAFQLLNTAYDRARFVEEVNPQLVLEYGGAIGATADEMTRFGIAYEDATRKAAKAATMGLSADQMSDVVEIAKKASIVLGRDFAESVDRLTAGIAKQERELLDEFGIIVSLTEAQEKYAAKIGKTRLQLSAYERQQAFASAVTEEGLKKYSNINATLTRTEVLLKNVAEGWQQFSIQLAKGEGALGTAATGLLTITEGLVNLGRELTGADEYSILYNKLALAANAYNAALARGNAEEIAKTAQEVNRLGTAFFYMNKGMPDTIRFLKTAGVEGFDEIAQLAEDAKNGVIGVDAALVDLSRRIVKQSSSITESWETLGSNFKVKGPFDTVIGELNNFLSISKEVTESGDKLAESTMNSFRKMSQTLNMTTTQVKETIEALKNLQLIQQGRSGRVAQLDIAEMQGGGANIQSVLGVRQAVAEVEEANKVVENQLVLFNRGVISAEDYSDAVFALMMAQAKLASEEEKLSRVQTTLINERDRIIAQRKLEQTIAGSAKDRVALAQKFLDIEKQAVTEAILNGEITGHEALVQREILESKQQQLDIDKQAAPLRDASALFSAMQQLEGLSQMQTTGLDIAGAFSDTFALAIESGMSFSDLLMTNSEAFLEFSTTMANAASTIFQSISQGKIDAIDREIEAEKRRDGQSAASLAKIKKLEAKKIKEQAKSKKAQVVMSTATAIMQGYAELGPIYGTVAAVALAAMGAMQLNQINKAASGQVEGLNEGGTGMKITGGNRSNNIDVSRSASAGEYSFVTGGSGVGNASNFQTPGRLGGGTSGAGTSVTVGERGPETITPQVPVSVSPAGEGNGGGTTIQNTWQIQAIDAPSFEQFAMDNSSIFRGAVETELNATNQTLDNV